MLQTKSWEPEAVLALIGSIVVSWVFGNVATGLLMQAGVSGFKTEVSVGSVLLATLSFHGVVLVLGAAFLKFHDQGWREILGSTGWKRCLALASAVLAVVTPVLFGLKYISVLALQKLHWPVEDQTAVEMILNARPGVRVYLFFFALVLVPLAEEFFFRGLLFTAAKQYGWPKLGWIGVSFLFALAHANAPTFLPLFVLALALTWLCEKTGGLLAPILAHSLFNTGNLILLLIAEKYHLVGP
jgi:membrane protease YdiL (CAAX protease family)